MPQQLSMICWSFTKCRILDEKLESNVFLSVAQVMTPSALTHSKPQEMASVAWALAKTQGNVNTPAAPGSQRPKVDISFEQCARDIAQECIRRDFAKFSGQDFSNICWSLTALDALSFNFAVAAAVACRRNPPQKPTKLASLPSQKSTKLELFSAYELSCVCRALSPWADKSPSVDQFMKDAITHITPRFLEAASPQTASNFAYALARSNQTNTEALRVAIRFANQKKHVLSSNEIAVVAWAGGCLARMLNASADETNSVSTLWWAYVFNFTKSIISRIILMILNTILMVLNTKI